MTGLRCNIIDCKNNTNQIRKNGKRILYHPFPKDPKIRKIWIQRCRRGGDWNPKSCFICSEHFKENDYLQDLKSELLNIPNYRKKLKPTAIPTLKLKEENSVVKKLERLENKSIVEELLKASEYPPLSSLEKVSEVKIDISQDHNYLTYTPSASLELTNSDFLNNKEKINNSHLNNGEFLKEYINLGTEIQKENYFETPQSSLKNDFGQLLLFPNDDNQIQQKEPLLLDNSIEKDKNYFENTDEYVYEYLEIDEEIIKKSVNLKEIIMENKTNNDLKEIYQKNIVTNDSTGIVHVTIKNNNSKEIVENGMKTNDSKQELNGSISLTLTNSENNTQTSKIQTNSDHKTEKTITTTSFKSHIPTTLKKVKSFNKNSEECKTTESKQIIENDNKAGKTTNGDVEMSEENNSDDCINTKSTRKNTNDNKSKFGLNKKLLRSNTMNKPKQMLKKDKMINIFKQIFEQEKINNFKRILRENNKSNNSKINGHDTKTISKCNKIENFKTKPHDTSQISDDDKTSEEENTLVNSNSIVSCKDNTKFISSTPLPSSINRKRNSTISDNESSNKCEKSRTRIMIQNSDDDDDDEICLVQRSQKGSHLDNFDIFGTFISSRLREMSNIKIAKKAEREILEIILKYEKMDEENETS